MKYVILGNAPLLSNGAWEDVESMYLLSSLMPPTCKERKIRAGTITWKD